MSELAGRVALVTGGGRGIGANIARELSRAGARVAVAARTGDQVASVAEELGGLALELDVTDQVAVERAVEETEEQLGPLDLLVANAGIGGPEGACVGGRRPRMVACLRGECPGRPPLLPGRDSADAGA